MDYKYYVKRMEEIARDIRSGRLDTLLELEPHIQLEVTTSSADSSRRKNSYFEYRSEPRIYEGLVHLFTDRSLHIESLTQTPTNIEVVKKDAVCVPNIAVITVPVLYALDDVLQIGLVYPVQNTYSLASTAKQLLKNFKREMQYAFCAA